MYKLICLFALVAVAAASYTPEQMDEVVNDIIHEAIPVISIDTNCLKNAGLGSISCLVSGLFSCFLSNGTNLAKLAACLASKCGGSAVQIIGCIKL